MASKKEVKVTINMAELLFDVKNDTYLRGRTVQNDQNYKEVASMFASDDEENQEKVLRSIKKGWGEVQTEVSEYLDENGLVTDNSPLDESTDLVLNLKMPTNFNEAATKGLGEAVHDYLKNSAIGDWYMVTNKADAADYVALAQKALENIRKSLSKRSRPARPAKKSA